MSAAVAAAERRAFDEAATWFADEVAGAAGRLDATGLGVWTVRDLVGHTSRALSTVRAYLTTDCAATDLGGPVDYFRRALRAPADTVAERGREAGRALGPDVPATVRALVEEVRAQVANTPDDAVAVTPFGRMHLADYLPSRTFELVVHTCDLAVALDRRPDPPPTAAASALRLAGDLATAGGHAGVVLLALTGRRALPEDFTILADDALAADGKAR